MALTTMSATAQSRVKTTYESQCVIMNRL